MGYIFMLVDLPIFSNYHEISLTYVLFTVSMQHNFQVPAHFSFTFILLISSQIPLESENNMLHVFSSFNFVSLFYSIEPDTSL
jgi:hypothetical protein